MPDVSAFDVTKFLEQTIDTPLERRPPLPVHNPESTDGLYIAMVGTAEYRLWESKKPDAKMKSGMSLDIPLKIQVPAGLQQSLGLGPELTINDSVFVDVTPQGTLDSTKGKNSGIRAYREACDLNKTGDSWSPAKMAGRPVKVKIEHEVYQGNPQERINRVLRP